MSYVLALGFPLKSQVLEHSHVWQLTTWVENQARGQENHAEHGISAEEHPPQVHANPLLTKVFWLDTKGKTRSWATKQTKVLEGTMTGGGPSSSKLKALRESRDFQECIGPPLTIENDKNVKLENVQAAELKKAMGIVRRSAEIKQTNSRIPFFRRPSFRRPLCLWIEYTASPGG